MKSSRFFPENTKRKKRRKYNDELTVSRIIPEYITFPSIFSQLPHETFELILKYADKYELRMWGAVCWAFHDYIAERKLFSAAPWPRLDYSKIMWKNKRSISEDFFYRIIILPNGDMLNYCDSRLTYLRYGDAVWKVLAKKKGLRPYAGFVLDEKYLVVHTKTGIGVWCIKDANGNIEPKKLQFLQHHFTTIEDELGSNKTHMSVRDNKDIVIFNEYRVMHVWKYHSAHEQSPFAADSSEYLPCLIPDFNINAVDQETRESIIKLSMAFAGKINNFMHFESPTAFMAWSFETNDKIEWTRDSICLQLQKFLNNDEKISSMHLEREQPWIPSGFQLLIVKTKTSTQTGIDQGCSYFLVNLSGDMPPYKFENVYPGSSHFQGKISSQGDLVVVADMDGMVQIFSGWDRQQNIFQTRFSWTGGANILNADVRDISSDGNVLIGYTQDVDPYRGLMIWDKKSNSLRGDLDVALARFSGSLDLIQYMPSGDLLCLSSYREGRVAGLKVIDCQTGCIKYNIPLATLEKDWRGMLRLLPTGDIIIRNECQNANIRPRIYRFGIWREPSADQQQNDPAVVNDPPLLTFNKF